METQENKSIAEKIIDGLKGAVVEIEELRLQAALGKAEANDLYEESKKKFKTYVHEAKHALSEVKTNATNDVNNFKSIFETLQVHLALGKAETKEVFEEQSKKISLALHDLELEIRKNEKLGEYNTRLLAEIEKFKIKLAILKLQFGLKKDGAKDEFQERKTQFLNHLAEIKTRLINNEKAENQKWEHFQDEMSDAYKNLKNLFVS